MPTKNNPFNFNDLTLSFTICNDVFGIKTIYTVLRILKSGPYTHVFWADGTKTSVRRSPDEPDNDYAAFTAALAIKMYGSNSALKKMIRQKVEVQKPKTKKSSECTDACQIDYDQIERDLAAANFAKTIQEATEHITKALIGNAGGKLNLRRVPQTVLPEAQAGNT